MGLEGRFSATFCLLGRSAPKKPHSTENKNVPVASFAGTYGRLVLKGLGRPDPPPAGPEVVSVVRGQRGLARLPNRDV